VLDYHLGGEMTGLEFCARLKAMGYDLPIVMVSGTASESIIIQALRVGVREFIPKTKDFLEDLPQAIGKVLERTRLEMQLTGSAQNIGKGGLVLIVEDDPATALLQRRQLERAGYVVVTATNAREPILRREWLRPGVHINAVGSSIAAARELDGATVAAASLFVDRRESTVNESGDYLFALKEGAVAGPEHIRAELGEIVIGKARGRESVAEITLFKSLGLAIEDLASAAFLYDKARRTGRGTWVEI